MILSCHSLRMRKKHRGPAGCILNPDAGVIDPYAAACARTMPQLASKSLLPELEEGFDTGHIRFLSIVWRSCLRSPRRRGLDSSPKVNSFSQREAQRRTSLRQRTSNTGDGTPRKSALRRRHSEAPHTTGPASSTEIGLHTVAVKLDGFNQTPMDGLYRRRDTVVIADHPTFFHTQGDNMFLYKNKSERWAISPTSLRNEDLVEAAKQGEQQGLACQKATGRRMDGTWIEFLNKRWVDVKLSVRTFNFEEYERHALGRHKRAAPLPHQPKVSFPNNPGVTRPRVQPLPPRPATVPEPELSPEQLLWQIQQEVRREDRDEKRRREQARQKATSPAMSTAGLHEQVFGAAAEAALPSSSAQSAAAAAKASALLAAASVMPPPVEASPLLAAASTMATPPKMVPEESTLLTVLTSQSSLLPPPQDTSRLSSSLAPKPEASGATEALPTPMPCVALQPPIVTEAQPLKPTEEDNPVPESAPAQKEAPNFPKTPPKAKPTFPKRWSYPGDDNVDSFLEKLRGKAPKQAADKDQQWQDSRSSRQDDEQEWDWSSQTWWDEWNDESWKWDERWSAKDTDDKQWFEPKDSWWAWEDRGSASWRQTWNEQSWKSEQDDESWGKWRDPEHGSGKRWTEGEQGEDKKPKDSKDGKEKAKEKKDKKEDKKDKKASNPTILCNLQPLVCSYRGDCPMDPIQAWKLQQARLGSKEKTLEELRSSQARWSDQDGLITESECSKAFKRILGANAEMPKYRLKEMFDEMDVLGKQRLDFRQFHKLAAELSQYMADNPKWAKEEEDKAEKEEKLKQQQLRERAKSDASDVFAILGIAKSKDVQETEQRKNLERP
eukprot:s3592_g4.t1